MNNLGKKIKTAREDAKMSQLQVGVALGVSDKTISGYESNRICPPVEKIQMLSEFLKKPLTFFIEDDERDYKISSRLRAVEITLRDIRKDLREIKLLAQKNDLD